VRVRFDRFYDYAALTETLEAWAAEFPELLRVESIGQSYEGRDILLATVTSLESGPPEEKPAVIVHAQIHGVEYTGTTAALSLLDRLLHGYGEDDRVTHAVDTRTFYVVPRVSPDAPEVSLVDGRFRRSSVRAYPRDEPQDGLHREDVDGDGRVLMMRLRDPNGAWKPHAEDSRLLVARKPDDVAGEFYRVFPEGTIHNWDGVTVSIAPVLEGLDLNRNWPADWAPEGEQLGAGPYPTSEPEVRALVQAIVDRPNITGYIGYHTFSGVHLRPYSARPDDDFPTADLRAFKQVGEEATRLTGYPAISIFHDFKYDPKMVIRGGDVDWMYDFLGVFAWVTEFWSPQRAAGLDGYHFIDWIRDHPPEDDLAILRVADEVGEGYVDWYPFEHPQLGPVELGGWDLVRFWYNPPLSRLEDEVKPHADFAIYLALVSPRLAVRSLESTPVGDGAFRLRLVLENAGWLPTHVTQKAVERKAVRPIEVALELPEGARVATGKEREEVGQLEGRSERRAVAWWNVDHSTSDRTKVEWVVEGKAGERVGVVARHDRAGTVRAEVVL
jgi:murein tripeptide amidase MpaA